MTTTQRRARALAGVGSAWQAEAGLSGREDRRPRTIAGRAAGTADVWSVRAPALPRHERLHPAARLAGRFGEARFPTDVSAAAHLPRWRHGAPRPPRRRFAAGSRRSGSAALRRSTTTCARRYAGRLPSPAPRSMCAWQPCWRTSGCVAGYATKHGSGSKPRWLPAQTPRTSHATCMRRCCARPPTLPTTRATGKAHQHQAPAPLGEIPPAG